MKTYAVPYVEVPAPVSAAFPGRRFFRRPVLRLALQNGQNRIFCYGIFDSGADYCVFPRSFMQPLGLDPLTAPIDTTSGVGSANIPAHFCDVVLDLGVLQFHLYAGFTTGMEHLGIGLLGQMGFFDKFTITFDYVNKLFVLETP